GGSFFDKILNTTLTEEQTAATQSLRQQANPQRFGLPLAGGGFVAAREVVVFPAAAPPANPERLMFAYRPTVDLAVVELNKVLSLRGEQRERLAKLLLAETHPPQGFKPYDVSVVLRLAAQ